MTTIFKILFNIICIILDIMIIIGVCIMLTKPNYKYVSKYQSRIVETTYENNLKTYSLQFKKVLIWWTYDTFSDIETCKEYYELLHQYEERLNKIKLHTKILDEKLINIY